MFDKLLIANRGEIACRIIKTARRMGIKTVAVYSEADACARHVRMADEAVLIGPAAARESYLAIDKIIAAAKATGAQAIHPGYGFLSENEAFCRACAEASLMFVGPPAGAIDAMGSKSAAKKLMDAAGVPLAPGYHGDDQSPQRLLAEAERIGYPVLIKAAAGGGGKGMRLVEQPEHFLDALSSCQREARASFGDEHMLVEKYIVRPRHIEIQVFADTFGHCVHLFERDCSVQRRHQKVLEEAPAPGMTPERRAAMGRAAVDVARAVGYVGAGTVEFIANQDGSFYFMEMNTRLQVEHPVTEMITGLDLVEWQLRVAAGEPLPLSQEHLQMRGHALEARIYAEDPDKGFLPSTGRLNHLSQPAENEYVRVDAGVEEGDEISPHYDPMIAKLIVWDQSRERALVRMRQALSEYRIVGVANNVEFLARLVTTPAFAGADLDTNLIEHEKSHLFPHEATAPDSVWLLAALAELLVERAAQRELARASRESQSPWHVHDGWRLSAAARRTLVFRCGGVEHLISVIHFADGFGFTLDGRQCTGRGELLPRGRLRAVIGDRHFEATVIATGERRQIFLEGHTWQLSRIDRLAPTDSHSTTEGSLLSPMPGRVIALLAEEGQPVERGAPLLILEAMKMEHTILAPSAGTLKSYRFAAGDLVSDGVELVEFVAE